MLKITEGQIHSSNPGLCVLCFQTGLDPLLDPAGELASVRGPREPSGLPEAEPGTPAHRTASTGQRFGKHQVMWTPGSLASFEAASLGRNHALLEHSERTPAAFTVAALTPGLRLQSSTASLSLSFHALGAAFQNGVLTGASLRAN